VQFRPIVTNLLPIVAKMIPETHRVFDDDEARASAARREYVQASKIAGRTFGRRAIYQTIIKQ
jgi:hypothetical protein